MKRIFRYLAVLMLVGGGMVAAVSGVVAFEAQIVGVDISVSNALSTTGPFTDILRPDGNDTVYPEEFLQDTVTVGLSAAFLDSGTNSRFDTVTFDVLLQCATLRTDFASNKVHWMGDFTYIADSAPGATLPGGTDSTPSDGVTNGGTTPNAGNPANIPWKRVLGTATGDSTDPLCQEDKVDVLTNQTMSRSGPTTISYTFGVDVPVCDYSYNPATDVTPKPNGYDLPSVILTSADPRFSTPDCKFEGGMDLVFQVTNLSGASESVFNTAPTASITSVTQISPQAYGLVGTFSDIQDAEATFVTWRITDSSNILLASLDSGPDALLGVAVALNRALISDEVITIELTVTDSGSLSDTFTLNVTAQ